MIGTFTYLAYLAITVPLTVWVAGLLSRGARVLLTDVLSDDDLADAVTRLLVMGFHLLGLGAVLMLMRGGSEPVTVQDMLGVLSAKIGAVALMLGFLHLVGVAVFNAIRQHSRHQLSTSPTPPLPATHHAPFPAPPVGSPYAGPRR